MVVNADSSTTLKRWMKRHTITPTDNQLKTLKGKSVSIYHEAQDGKTIDTNGSVKF